MQLFEATGRVDALAVSTEEIYFSTDAHLLQACPKSGCQLAPRQVVTMTYSIPAIAWLDNGTVVFQSAPARATQRPSLYGCPDSGCPGAVDYFTQDGMNGFYEGLVAVGDRVVFHAGGLGLGSSVCTAGTCGVADYFGPRGKDVFTADTSAIYFVQRSADGTAIVSCAFDRTEETCTPKTVVGGDQSTTTAMDVFGGELYWVAPGREGYVEGTIRYLALSDRGNAASTLAQGLDSPTALVVDEDGAFWITFDPPTLQRCASGRCPGGAQTMVTGLVAPTGLTTDEDFVYWIDDGVIWRIAK
jgi:hypothetical protein